MNDKIKKLLLSKNIEDFIIGITLAYETGTEVQFHSFIISFHEGGLVNRFPGVDWEIAFLAHGKLIRRAAIHMWYTRCTYAELKRYGTKIIHLDGQESN